MTAALALAAALGLFGDPDAKVTIEISESSLTDVLTTLTAVTGVPIEVDDAARKKLGDPDRLMVSLKVKDITLTSAVKGLLATHAVEVRVIDRKTLLVTAK